MSSAPNIAIEFDKEYLDRIFLGYADGKQYINEFLFPFIEVSSQTGSLPYAGTLSQEHLRINLPTEIKGGNSRIERIQYSESYTTGWSTIAHSIGMDIDPETCWKMAPHTVQVQTQNGTNYAAARYQAGFNNATTKFTRMLKTNRLTVAEYAATQLACTAGSYASTNKITLSGTSQWNDPNSDVLGEVKDAKKAVWIYSGTPANRMVISLSQYFALQVHPQLVEAKRIAFTGGRSIDFELTLADLSVIFGLDVRFADAQYETANHGAVSSKSYIWGNFAWVGYVNPNPTKDNPEYSFGFNFWRTPMGATARVSMRVTDKDQHSAFGQTQTIYAEEEYDQMVTSFKAGYLFTNPIA